MQRGLVTVRIFGGLFVAKMDVTKIVQFRSRTRLFAALRPLLLRGSYHFVRISAAAGQTLIIMHQLWVKKQNSTGEEGGPLDR